MNLRFVSVTCIGIALFAQAPAPQLDPARQPDTQAMTTAVRNLRRASTASDAVKAEADKLIAGTGDARRRMANAFVLLNGGTWDAKQDFAWSVQLRPDKIAVDSSLPVIVKLSQYYAVPVPAGAAVKASLSLLHEDGTLVRQLGSYDIISRNLVDQPLGMDPDLDGVPNGAYLLQADVVDGAAPMASSTAPLQIVRGLERDRADIEKRLTKVQGHDGTKATIRYPYVLAQTVNVGRRLFSGADFGLPYQPQPVYDFPKGVATSATLLKALETGKDPLYRAKGDSERHYWFEDAREMMAYHVYAPMKWDGKAKLPMVLVLHGNTRDQDYYFDRDDHILAKLAEQHGFLVVCPMGYRPSAGWGSGRGGRTSDLSEKDALNVLDLVTKEYPIDASRIYLFGHSAGGAGTWYMGQKYAEKWAAIAASAAATRPANFQFDRLKGMPIMVCHGDKDDEVPVTSSRNMVKAATEAGLDPQYLEVPGGTHLTIVALVEPKVFDFFEQQKKK